METLGEGFVKIEDLYVAYRKAKVDCFYERDHATALQFAHYEIRLAKNLRHLLNVLNAPEPNWFRNADFVGTYSYIPKSIEPCKTTQEKDKPAIFSDPDDAWRAICNGGKAKADFRIVGRHPVDYHIISALWIQKVGHLFDAILKPCAFANRVRRVAVAKDRYHPPCRSSLGSFKPYSFGFRTWRATGMSAMMDALEAQKAVVAITADLRSFYHKTSPRYLLKPEFLGRYGIELTDNQTLLTQQLITSLETWAGFTPEHSGSAQTGLPVGLSAPRLIANVILHEFDRFVTRELSPLYYGRYVDDVFLVLENTHDFSSSGEVWNHIVRRSDGLVVRTERGTETGYQINLPYSPESDLVFIGSKQKVFALRGSSGISLLEAIVHTITQRSSDWRMLPDLPTDEEDLAFEFLNAGRDAAEEVDNLRKADGITVQRLGFALRLRNFEAVRRDLPPEQWKEHREKLYQIVLDHVVTAPGVFAYSPYIARLVSLAVACGDYERAAELLRRTAKVFDLVRQTSNLAERQWEIARGEFLYLCYVAALKGLANFQQVYGRGNRSALPLLLNAFEELGVARLAPDQADRLALLLLQCDLGIDAYREFWIESDASAGPNKEPLISLPPGVRRELFLDDALEFLRRAHFSPDKGPKLKPDGKAIPRPIAFPTRPFTTAEISLLDQPALKDWKTFRKWVRALRGRIFDELVEAMQPPEPSDIERQTGHFIFIPHAKAPKMPLVALPAFATEHLSWKASVMGQPEPDGERYFRINRLINAALAAKPRPHYFILPELSLPRRWFNLAAHRLEHSGISLIAGLEYEHWGGHDTKSAPYVSNQVRAGLITDILGYPSLVFYQQEKERAAPEEADLLRQLANKELQPRKRVIRYVIQHETLHFGILICSELTNIELRANFRGVVDALVVPEWNQDINSFSSLIEAAALDVHCFVIQVNNRHFGDCRVRAPYRAEYMRDLARVKGGVADYYVIAKLDIPGLRAFQSMARSPENPLFKPKPDGYAINPTRIILGDE